MNDEWTVDFTTARFQEWIAAHPKPVLTDHEQAALDRAFDVPDWMQIRAELGGDY